ncbi:MAG: adenylyltransferase/cytidyltransferase family protein [Clostridia bacterium]|nr:adenylyltransferase/cytidyltransferase family protein [Clostridia bacterium]
MEEIRQLQAVCLGFFDGVHRGHLALIDAARAIARQEGLRVCVHTFDHAPGSKGLVLTTLEERERLLRAAGADEVAVSQFSDEFRRMSGDDFFRLIVLGRLRARHVVCGDDHRFGYMGGWGVKELHTLCDQSGVGLTVVPAVTLPDGTRISSTAIRRAIEAGDWARAEEMLGRPLPPAIKKSLP